MGNMTSTVYSTNNKLKINSPTLGEKLRYFRKRANLSQLTLETEIEASAGSISRIEKGIINPTKETVLNIAEALTLNDIEISYLIGKLAIPATLKEVDNAKAETYNHFQKKNFLAYLIDDRSRMWDLSTGFCHLLKLSDSEKKQLIGKTMPQIILDPSLGLRQYIETEDFADTVYYAFRRTWDEMNFMKGDPWYEEILQWINSDSLVKQMWQEYYMKPDKTNVRTDKSRTVHFKYMGKEFKMLYTNEMIPKYPRFRVVSYKPTNFILKILSRLV